MKALTIKQPYASLLAHGIKKYETRSWSTVCRGPIAIHAGLANPCKVIRDLFGMPQHNALISATRRCGYKTYSDIPTGAIIATAHLAMCRIIRVDDFGRIYMESPCTDRKIYVDEQEIAMGNWAPNHYAWELGNVKILPEPIPAKGQLGLWGWQQC
jgi:hypothetical protein